VVYLEATAVDRYFYWLNEREKIKQLRNAEQRFPWTSDHILQKYRFTNVYREDDKVTQIIRKTFREPLNQRFLETCSPEDMMQLVFSIIGARWFNRAETISQLHACSLLDINNWDPARTEARLSSWRPKGPWVTGSFIIRGRPGGNKLQGVLWCIHQAYRKIKELSEAIYASQSLEKSVDILSDNLPYMAGFLGYEVVCDLQYTKVLGKATDKYTWANPTGPGGKRGAARLLGEEVPGNGASPDLVLDVMSDLMDRVNPGRIAGVMGVDGPLPSKWLSSRFEGMPFFTMREIENGLCEFDKYERTRLGQGRPRGTFKS